MGNFVTQPYGDGLTDGQRPNSFFGKETQASICHSTIKEMVRLTALSNEQNQPVIRLGKKGQPCNSSTRKWLLLNGRNRLPQELVRLLTYPANSQPRNGCAIWVRSLTPRAGTIIYYAQQAALSTKTTRSPTPRAVRSTTSPKERHNHSNNSVAYPKSGTIDYFAQRAAQSLQQLSRLPQERYDRLLRPASGIYKFTVIRRATKPVT